MQDITLKINGKAKRIGYKKHFGNLLRLNESLGKGASENYGIMGVYYADAPEIVGITGACENVDTLFKVYNRSNLPLFFTQTGQLALEQALQSFHGVYTVIHSGRDEEEEDERHLRQFRLTEEEFDCTLAGMTRKTYDDEKMFQALLDHIQKTVHAMIKKVLDTDIRTLENYYGRNTEKLQQAIKKDFYRINYEEAIELLNKHGFPNLVFGEDLKAVHEAKIVSLMNKKKEEIPVFITRYPKEIKFFNMKVSNKDSRVVLSADLIFPYAGEGTGSAVREHDFAKLNDRLLTSTMYKLHVKRGGTYKDFEWYLDIMKHKRTEPHAGYGIGNERVLQYILGTSDIRNVSAFSLMNMQTGDWDSRKTGKLSMYIHKRNILLSIGKVSDKKFLMQTIKTLQPDRYVLYATEKTHAFLKENGIKATLVFKISQHNKKPNISDLMNQRIFDIVVNIPKHPYSHTPEHTDGYLIRRMAVDSGVTLITDVKVAQALLEKLSSETVSQSIQPKDLQKDGEEQKTPFRNLMYQGISVPPLQWTYDIGKSYDWNYDFGPKFKGDYPDRSAKPAKKFLSFSVNSLFGIPAGPLLNSRWIETYAKLGFDILTYKTVRTRSYSAHSMPHILYVEKRNPRSQTQDFTGKPYLSKYDQLTITNSFGVPSKDPDVWQEDVQKALGSISQGQLMIVSVMGTIEAAKNQKAFIDDFAKCAGLAVEAGAPVIEVNLSCPNLHTGGIVCYDEKLSALICREIKNAIGNIPLIAKIGYFADDRSLRDFVVKTNPFIDGIAAINTVKGQITDVQRKKTAMRTLKVSGVCGSYIKPYGLDMVKRLAQIRKDWNMNYAILGIGGVTSPEDYTEYLDTGADVVQSGTGAMMDPYLAHKIYEKETNQKNDYQNMKSVGSTFFQSLGSTLTLDDYKKMYFEMVLPKNLSESKQTLLIHNKPFVLKNGEQGRKTSHIYMNHRNPIFVDAWDRRLLVHMLDAIIREKIQEKGKYGVIAIPSSSSPELTSLMLDSLSERIDRSVILADHVIRREHGAHQIVYGDVNGHKPWVMIDDVFTSGTTFRRSLEKIKKSGNFLNKKENMYAVSFVCRNPEVGEDFTKDTDCKLFYCATMDEILKYHWVRFTQTQKKIIKNERKSLS